MHLNSAGCGDEIKITQESNESKSTQSFGQDIYLERKSDIHKTKLYKSGKKLADIDFYRMHVMTCGLKIWHCHREKNLSAIFQEK